MARHDPQRTSKPSPAEWFVERNGKFFGPFTLEQLVGFVDAGKLRPDHRVRTKGTPWATAGSIEALFGKPPASDCEIDFGYDDASPSGLPDADRYCVVRKGRESVPMTFQTLKRAADYGNLEPEDEILQEVAGTLMSIGLAREQEWFPGYVPPVPSPPPAAPSKTASRYGSMRLVAGIGTAVVSLTLVAGGIGLVVANSGPDEGADGTDPSLIAEAGPEEIAIAPVAPPPRPVLPNFSDEIVATSERFVAGALARNWPGMTESEAALADAVTAMANCEGLPEAAVGGLSTQLRATRDALQSYVKTRESLIATPGIARDGADWLADERKSHPRIVSARGAIEEALRPRLRLPDLPQAISIEEAGHLRMTSDDPLRLIAALGGCGQVADATQWVVAFALRVLDHPNAVSGMRSGTLMDGSGKAAKDALFHSEQIFDDFGTRPYVEAHCPDAAARMERTFAEGKEAMEKRIEQLLALALAAHFKEHPELLQGSGGTNQIPLWTPDISFSYRYCDWCSRRIDRSTVQRWGRVFCSERCSAEYGSSR